MYMYDVYNLLLYQISHTLNGKLVIVIKHKVKENVCMTNKLLRHYTKYHLNKSRLFLEDLLLLQFVGN
jgi:hypothetical protein